MLIENVRVTSTLQMFAEYLFASNELTETYTNIIILILYSSTSIIVRGASQHITI